MSVHVYVWYFVYCPFLFISSVLSLLPFMIRVCMAGAVHTLVWSVSVHVWVFLYAVLVSSYRVLSFLTFMLCVMESLMGGGF